MKFVALLSLTLVMLPVLGAGCSGTEVPIAENGAGTGNQNTSGKSATDSGGTVSVAGKSSSTDSGGTAPTEPNSATSGAPDSSSAGQPSDAPTDTTFQCGPQMKCEKSQLCVGLVGGIGGDEYQCQEYPPQCQGNHSCACVKRSVCAVCNDDAGGVVQECQVG